ncbi:NADP-dependent oxidoreductase [Flexivirga lutea]
MKAVRYDHFGGLDVLHIRDVLIPRPAPEEVIVRVHATGINPGETALRTGALAAMFPSAFPSGQGSDLAGVISELGAGVTGWQVGDAVIGWVDTRSSHAEYAAVPITNLVPKPSLVPWTVGGALFVAGSTAWSAVRAVDPGHGDTVVVSGAAGGVGSLAAQLAVERGATVLGLAGAANHAWLEDQGVIPVDYAGGADATLARIRDNAPGGVAAFIDTFGQAYVDLAVELGVSPRRINTIIDFAAAERFGTRTAGSADGANTADMRELVTRLADGRLQLPIAATYSLAEVRQAYAVLEQRHTRGKIVLLP